MARSRNRRKAIVTPAKLARKKRWSWPRVAGGIAEFWRNAALVAMSTPFAEPLLTGAPIDVVRAFVGLTFGFGLLSMSVIIDHRRSP